MDKYEAYINRYSALSKQKESSSLREDTFQMYEQRKLFVQSNASYFHRLISLKGNLENLLVECFSGALGAHLDEIDESANSCGLLRERLPGWKQWLEESKVTCEYQMQRMEKRCNELESVYLQQTKPLRALENYSASTHHQLTMIKSVEPEEDIPLKHGYLNARCVVAGKNARINWVRKWFYIQAGEFGTCSVSSINKEKGCIFLGDRIKLSDSECKMTTETDRRFCFEIIHSKWYVNCSMILFTLIMIS